MRLIDPGCTFPTWDPQVRLDYLIVPGKILSAVKSCRVLYDAPGAREASDHFPLLSEIDSSGITITHVLVTHQHGDHVGP